MTVMMLARRPRRIRVDFMVMVMRLITWKLLICGKMERISEDGKEKP